MAFDESRIKVKQHSLNPVRPDRIVLPERSQYEILEQTGMHEQQLTETALRIRSLLETILYRHGKGPINLAQARRLSEKVGMPIAFWLRMPEEMEKVFNANIVSTAGAKRRLTRHGLRD